MCIGPGLRRPCWASKPIDVRVVVVELARARRSVSRRWMEAEMPTDQIPDSLVTVRPGGSVGLRLYTLADERLGVCNLRRCSGGRIAEPFFPPSELMRPRSAT